MSEETNHSGSDKPAVASNALLDFLIAIFHPSTWIQCDGVFSREWDAELRKIIASDTATIEKGPSDCKVKINGYEVWIANHPYASMQLQIMGGLRPRRATILRAYAWLVRMLFKSNPGIDNRPRTATTTGSEEAR